MIPSSLYCHACGAENATDRSVCFACQQPLQLVASDNALLLQDRYRILTQVGKGGFGAVYRAEDTLQHGSIVAVKRINLRGLTPQETIEATDAFNREVSLLSNLSHPNLPHIYDNFTDPEHWYLVMDFIEGETLETYLEAKGANYTASLDEVLTLGIELCSVLHYLHTREPAIIFRDLKPANIMRTVTGKLYLIDFGIARNFKPGKLRDTIPFGSPGYAAPEQYGKAQTTPRADIYSLGALLHMLLTGDDPVDNPFHFAPLRMYGVPGLSDLESLLLRMVQVDVSSRPATVIEVKEELQRIMDMQVSPRIWHAPVGQTPPSLPSIQMDSGQQQMIITSTGQQQLYVPLSQRKRTSRRKFLVGGFAIAGLTVIGAGGIANIMSALQVQSQPEALGAPPPQHITSKLFGHLFEYLGQSQPVHSVVWSQGDTRLASASDDQTIQVWTVDDVVNAYDMAPKYLFTTTGSAVSLAWGAERSKNILAFTSGKTVTVWDIITPTTTVISPILSSKGKDVSTDMFALAWSPDGRYIVFPTNIGVQIWDSVRSVVVSHIEFDTDQEPITSLSWSSNGNYIAVGMLTRDETIILDVAKQRVVLIPHGIGGGSVTWSPDSSCLATVHENYVYISTFEESHPHTTTYQFLNNVTALAWSYNSKFLVAASDDIGQNIHVWSPFTKMTDQLPSEIGKSIGNDGSTFTTFVDTHKTEIHSLAWSSENQYIAISADKAYLMEIDVNALNGMGQQGSTVQRRRKRQWTHYPSRSRQSAFQGPHL